MAGEVFDARPRNGASYVVGDTAVPLAHVTVSALLAETVRRCPDDEAVVFREQNVRQRHRCIAHHI